MKKLIPIILAILIISVSPAKSQAGRLLNKVSKSVADKIDGKPQTGSSSTNKEPEPKCACEQPELALDLGGSLKLNYSEISISMRDDGAMLVKEKFGSDYYIVKDGTTQGPIKEGDPRLTGFEDPDNQEAPTSDKAMLNNQYITRSGEKFTIKFAGKNYGPYSQINEFKVSKSKDKFAAIVVENVAVSESDGKKMEEAIKNAKTDQERMDLAMKYSQQMAQKMQAAGGPMSQMPKLVTNIASADYDPMKSRGGTLNNNVKYDDILFTTYDKVIDLSNKVLLTLKPDENGAKDLFVSSNNSKYAVYKYGTMTFSDGTTMSDMFNPHLVKAGSQVYLAYMYYSPKRNAIMQCKIPF
jgi:hypothetical protein